MPAVLSLSRAALPDKVLAANVVAVQEMLFDVLFCTLIVTDLIGLFQETSVSGKSSCITTNMVAYPGWGFCSDSRIFIFNRPAVVSQAAVDIVHSIDRHAGVFNKKVFHWAHLHLHWGLASCGETGGRSNEPALLQSTGVKLKKAGVTTIAKQLKRRGWRGEHGWIWRGCPVHAICFFSGAVSASIYIIYKNPFFIFFFANFELLTFICSTINLSKQHGWKPLVHNLVKVRCLCSDVPDRTGKKSLYGTRR